MYHEFSEHYTDLAFKERTLKGRRVDGIVRVGDKGKSVFLLPRPGVEHPAYQDTPLTSALYQ